MFMSPQFTFQNPYQKFIPHPTFYQQQFPQQHSKYAKASKELQLDNSINLISQGGLFYCYGREYHC